MAEELAGIITHYFGNIHVAAIKLEGELTTAEALGFVRSLASFATPILVLSGGEPLERADIYDIASEAAGLGLRVALATNGTLVDDEAAAKVKAAGIVRASISFDGPDAAIHDAFRAHEGSFDQAIAGLKRLQAAGLETQINTTVARHNVDALPGVLWRLPVAQHTTRIHLAVPSLHPPALAEVAVLIEHNVFRPAGLGPVGVNPPKLLFNDLRIHQVLVNIVATRENAAHLVH